MQVVSTQPKVTVIPAKTDLPKLGQPAAKKLRVAAYCRVSSEKDEQINSFEVQVSYYTEKIGSNPQWKLVNIYADEGITGTSMKHREDFKRMLRACREGRIDLILVKSVSRFGRNNLDTLKTIRALQERGVGVIFEKEGLDTRTMNSELLLAFHSAFSQSESESIRENVRWGWRRAFEQGKVMVSPAMFGFCQGPDGKPAIDEEQAEAVRWMYREYLNGKSIAEIKRGLEQQGVKTSRGGDVWNCTVIQHILQNEKYKGDALLQKTYKPSLFADRCVENNELPKYYVSGCLPVIVEPEIFDRVQEEMAKRRAKRPTSEKAKNPLFGKYSGKYALSSLLVCGKCGSPYRRATWNIRGKKKIVWRCASRLDFGTKYCKDSPSIAETALQDAVMKAIAERYIDREQDMALLTANLERALAPEAHGDENALRRRLAELQAEKQSLIVKALDEKDDGKYDFQFARIMQEMESVKAQLGEIEADSHSRKLADSQMLEIQQLLADFQEKPLAFNDVLVRKTVAAIHVLSKDEIEITFADGQTSKVEIK